MLFYPFCDKLFNIGMNAGEVAGQTIFHTHIHLKPRRKGDVENARGGVWGSNPSKKGILITPQTTSQILSIDS